jgi:hypothetical protein
LYLDLNFDDTSFEKYFEYVDIEHFARKMTPIPVVEGEVKLKSLKVVDKKFLFEIEPALNAYEKYLIQEYGGGGNQPPTFPFLFYERSGLVHQLRIMDEGTQHELWCVRDDQKGQCFRVVCRTLYDVRLKKRVQT